MTRIEDFELLGNIGQGTYGSVDKAKHRATGNIVAIKKIGVQIENE